MESKFNSRMDVLCKVNEFKKLNIIHRSGADKINVSLWTSGTGMLKLCPIKKQNDHQEKNIGICYLHTLHQNDDYFRSKSSDI